MIARILKASDSDYIKLEKDFTFDITTFKRLEKKFNHSEFIVDLKSFDDNADIDIIVYDDYVE